MDVKKILIPTDFSKYADYAGDVAFEIAKKTGAGLQFYHQLHFLVNFKMILFFFPTSHFIVMPPK